MCCVRARRDEPSDTFGINNSPGEITTKRSKQHRAYSEMIGCRYADCARDGESHYQTEWDFREPFDWLEYPVGQSHEGYGDESWLKFFPTEQYPLWAKSGHRDL
jgi:hypothetical protein